MKIEILNIRNGIVHYLVRIPRENGETWVSGFAENGDVIDLDNEALYEKEDVS